MPSLLSALRASVRRRRARAGDDLAQVLAEAKAAVAGLPAGTKNPVLWVYAPAMPNNPFQEMLYSRMADHGIATLGCRDLRTALYLRAQLSADVKVVAHQHWTHRVLHHETSAGAAKAVDRFLQGIRDIQDARIPVMWTIHNTLPHDARFREEEQRLQRELSRLADRVHVMSPRTAELCSDWFETPAQRNLQLAHPSYDGIYPDTVTRADARVALNIAADETVFVMFGAIKPYKGFSEALVALDELARTSKVRLIVAGRADASPATAAMVEALQSRSYALVRTELVPADEIQIYMRAADIALLPYRRTLNSGALALALTFGIPVIMPTDSGSLPLLRPEFSEVYDPSDAQGLTRAVANSLRLVTEQARLAARRAADEVRLENIAEEFAMQARSWIDGNFAERDQGARS